MIGSSQKWQTTDQGVQNLVTNALYVAFCTHARQVSDFLRNGGPSSSIHAKDYIPNRRTQKDKPDWARDVDDKVVHFGKGRIPNYTVDVEHILQNLEQELLEFYDALPPEKKDWFAVIPECYPKQEPMR
jgi:hypothetical protein